MEGILMSVKSRLSKINQIAETASLVHDDGKSGRKSYRVNSSGKPLQIHTKVYFNGILQAQAFSYTYNHKEQINIQGNRQVDFHSKTVADAALGALKKRAKDSGKTLSICLGSRKESYQNAKKLLNFGGQLVQIRNLGKGVVWGVFK